MVVWVVLARVGWDGSDNSGGLGEQRMRTLAVVQGIARLPSTVVVPSGRFIVRRYVAQDAPALQQALLDSLDHLRPWMPWIAEEPLSAEQRAELFTRWDDEWVRGESAVYGIFTGQQVIGGTGLHRRREGRPDIVEIGYWVHVDHLNRGVATEVAAALTDAAFAVEGTTAVEILHAPDNAASRAVPRKLGYEYTGEHLVRGQMFSTWNVSRATWTSRPPAPAPAR